jgi:hypothetical protein
MTKRHVMKDEAGIDSTLLQKFLAGVGDVQEDVFRAFFGPSKTAEFLAQGWITCTINRDLSGNEEVHYDWGPRAEMTVNKKARKKGNGGKLGHIVNLFSKFRR